MYWHLQGGMFVTRYSLEVRPNDGEAWFHVGDFSTIDAATKWHSRSHSSDSSQGRLIDRYNGVIQPVYFFNIDPDFLADYKEPDNSFFSPEVIERIRSADNWGHNGPPQFYDTQYMNNFGSMQDMMQLELNRINRNDLLHRYHEMDRRVRNNEREARLTEESHRRLNNVNFANLWATGRLKEKTSKKKFKIEWWKDGF